MIGVIGSKGNLGSRLVARLEKNGQTVMCSDRSDATSMSPQVLFEKCDVVHLCIPIDKFEYTITNHDTTAVLHDSVVNTSLLSRAKFDGDVAIVHMLMNDADTVVVGDSSDNIRVVSEHFTSLGYKVQTMSINEHDTLMAQSQAPFALLIRSLHEPLHEYNKRSLLTPSGTLLMETLDKRVLAWTPETIHSILKNPRLGDVIKEMSEDYARHNRP